MQKFSWRHNVYNAKFSEETHLDNDLAMEETYFH